MTPENSAELGAVLGTIVGEGALVTVARDYYPPSRMLKRSFTAGLMSTGVSVIDFHAATLPEVAFAVKRFGAKAGVHFSVTPFNDNSIQVRIIDSAGIEITGDRLEDILSMFESHHAVRAIPTRIGWVTYAEYIHDIYASSATSYIDSAPITAKEPLVLVDMNFGPASEVFPNILSSIGARFIGVNSGRPPPNLVPRQLPSLKTLNMLGELCKATGASFAVALSSDASHAYFIDDKGRYVDPDIFLAIVALMIPQGSRLAITDSASRIVDAIAEKNKLSLIRVKGIAGDIARGVRRLRVNLGATDSGEVIFPQFSLSPDGMILTAKLLEMLSTEEVRLSTLVEAIPEASLYTLELEADQSVAGKVLDAVFLEHTEVAVAPGMVKYRVGETWVKVHQDLGGGKIYVSVDSSNKAAFEIAKKEYERLGELIESLK
jgi:phosphomannomutase